MMQDNVNNCAEQKGVFIQIYTNLFKIVLKPFQYLFLPKFKDLLYIKFECFKLLYYTLKN